MYGMGFHDEALSLPSGADMRVPKWTILVGGERYKSLVAGGRIDHGGVIATSCRSRHNFCSESRQNLNVSTQVAILANAHWISIFLSVHT